MGRAAASNYGGGHNPATFGLSKFMGIEPDVCWDVAGVGEVEFPIMETGFLEDDEASPDRSILDLDDDEEEEESLASGEEKAAFWKKQHLVLEVSIFLREGSKSIFSVSVSHRETESSENTCRAEQKSEASFVFS